MIHVLGLGIPQVKCGVGFHPSMGIFRISGENTEDAVKRIQAPIMFLAAWLDAGDIKRGGMVDQALKEKPFYKECVFKTFDDMVHGWVNRGIMGFNTTKVKRDYVEAMDLCMAYFDKYS
jgi:dienelactone hydrolase